ncbi:MAG TPA: S9 family peptidase, partial [bacterium]|nr:S9 family peptidase [bacterium]
FMVVASMAEYPDDYICGMNNVGIADFVNFLKNTKSYRRKLREVEYGPLEDEEFLRSISPTEMAHKIDGSLLVVHGARDPRVPVTDAYLLVERMQKAGKHVEKLIFEDEGHGYRKKENRIKYYETTAEFIEKCNEK